MKAPTPARNAPRWSRLLRAAEDNTAWVVMPWSQRAYRSLLRVRRRLLLSESVAVVGRKSDGHIWIGPMALARELRAGLRGHMRGERA